MKALVVLSWVILAGLPSGSLAQVRTISILDSETGRPLEGANAQNLTTKEAAASDPSGLLRLWAGAGDSIHISHIAYSDTTFIAGNDQLWYNVLLGYQRLDEVVVFAEEPFNRRASLGVNSVPMEFLTAVPSLGGEPDIIKTIMFLPGVSAGNEGYSHLFVRGGNQDQNLFLFDGATMFNVNHFGGFISMFHPDLIGSVNFYKSYWPSKYGGRLSSVMDIRTAEGNYKEHRQSMNFSLLAPKISASGPLWKDKVSYSLGGRRTILDLVTGPIARSIRKGRRSGDIGSLVTGDANLRIDARISDDQHLSFSTLYGRDRYLYAENDLSFGSLAENVYQIRNNVAALNYHWSFSPSTSFSIHSSYSGYRHFFDDRLTEDYTRNYYGPLQPFDIKHNYRRSGNSINSLKILVGGSTRLASSWKLSYGAEREWLDYKLYLNRSEKREIDGKVSFTDRFSSSINRNNVSTTALFADIALDITSRWKLNAGLRISHYRYGHQGLWLAEPKLLLTYDLDARSTVNAGFNRQRQHITLLGFIDQNGYFREFYTSADRQAPPSLSRQWSAGYFRSATGWIDNFSIEMFYKEQSGITKFIPFTDQDKAVINYSNYLHTDGKRRSYGIELLIQKTVGAFHGSLAYTYSRSQSSFPSLNRGRPFNADFDFRHAANILLIYRFGKGYRLSGQWTYKTGRPFTVPGSRSQDGFAVVFPVIDELNNYRLPAFHRLDLSIDREWLSRKGKKNWFGIGVYNAYNRVNPFFARPADEPGKLEINGLFPIIPFFHIGFEP